MQCGPRKGHEAPHCHPGRGGAMVLSPALQNSPAVPHLESVADVHTVNL